MNEPEEVFLIFVHRGQFEFYLEEIIGFTTSEEKAKTIVASLEKELQLYKEKKITFDKFSDLYPKTFGLIDGFYYKSICRI